MNLYSGELLVQNIGFDGSGTHCDLNNSIQVLFISKPIQIEKIKVIENKTMKKLFSLYFKATQKKDLKWIIKKIIKKIVKKIFNLIVSFNL